MAVNGGNFGLRDFERDVPINFGQDNLPNLLVSSLHQDLYNNERKLNHKLSEAKDKNKKTNFLFAKVGIYGEAYSFFHLHEMINEPTPIVFHCASITDLTDCCEGYDISRSDVPALAMINESYRNNVAARSGSYGINKRVYDDIVVTLDTIEETIKVKRQEVSKSAKQLFKEVEKQYNYKSGDEIDKLEIGIQASLGKIEEDKLLYQRTLNKFVGGLWHSEPRLLSFLREDNCIPDFLSRKVIEINGRVDLIILHIHSRYNICDNCRLQLTGAMYKWIYNKDIFVKSET